jgi:hypothetical protein
VPTWTVVMVVQENGVDLKRQRWEKVLSRILPWLLHLLNVNVRDDPLLQIWTWR